MGKFNSEELAAEEKRLISEYSDLKIKLDFYLISLPFIALGMSISSYKVVSPIGCHVVAVEIASWILFLLSGLLGLLSKFSYLEALLLSVRSVRGRLSLETIPGIHHRGVLESNSWLSDLPADQDRKLCLTRRSERALLLLFVFGFILLIVSRAIAILSTP